MNSTRQVVAASLTFFLSLPFSITSFAAGGDADPSFGGAGYVRYAAARALPVLLSATLALDDGSVIAAGAAGAEVVVQHYRADGSLDETFGLKGTTYVPALVAVDRAAPNLQLVRDSAGRIIIEQNGTVRRLSSTGVLDTSYTPAAMNVRSRQFGDMTYRLLPQPDGRFIVVTAQQANVETSQISVRFFNADGTPDTTRGPFGERLVYPGGEGTYTKFPLSATTDANGKILIAARWDRNASDVSLVLIRLNPDGSYDTSFGQGGVVLIGSQLGTVSAPQVIVGRDGRIGYLFGVPSDELANPQPDPYFVVYVLTANGQIDASAPSGGRISIFVPASQRLNLNTLGWVSGSPDLTVIGTTTTILPTFAAQNRLMLWHADLATGTIGPAVFTDTPLAADFRLGGKAGGPNPGGFSASGNRLWIAEGEGWYTFAALGGTFTIPGTRRGVLIGYDIDMFGAGNPIRIAPTFPGHADEALFAVTELSDRKLLALGFVVAEQQRLGIPTLTRFTADGRIDPSFGAGTGRIEIAAGDGLRGIFLPSPVDSPTVFRSGYNRCGQLGCSYSASVVRLDAGGNPVAGFGSAGTVTLASIPLLSSDSVLFIPGFVDEQRLVTVAQIKTTSAASTTLPTITPVRIDGQGSSTSAVAQSLPRISGSPVGRIDRLPDGRWQAIVAGSDPPGQPVGVVRWSGAGAVDPATPSAIVLPNILGNSSSIDTRVLSDGRTLVALDSLIFRLKADGTLDLTFGNGGTVAIPFRSFNFGVGLAVAAPTSRMSIDTAGRILIAYPSNSGTGVAMTVARFTADGQPDTTFTSDGRFDSVFSLNNMEQAAGLATLRDGAIVAAGQSDNFSVLLRLEGTATSSAGAGMPVVEYYNTHLDHFFVTASPAEMVGVDKGLAGPGWQRTGHGFRAFIEADAPGTPVCRFYGTPGRGPNSHFYTANAAECSAVKQDPGWTYEGIAFSVFAPQNGQCVIGTPVYRGYNNGFARNDSNHRYSDNLARLEAMRATGWTVEGVALCGVAFAPVQ